VALAAMVGAAVYFVLSSRPLDGLPGTALAAGGLLVGGLLLLLAGSVGMVGFTATSAPAAFAGHAVAWWVPVILLGVVPAAVAYGSGIAATRRLGARLASFVALSEVLAALLSAWALLGQAPAPAQLLGGVAIVAGVIAVRRGEPAA
jgi:drug/metabolite transporter (DMT)-like permease